MITLIKADKKGWYINFSNWGEMQFVLTEQELRALYLLLRRHYDKRN